MRKVVHWGRSALILGVFLCSACGGADDTHLESDAVAPATPESGGAGSLSGTADKADMSRAGAGARPDRLRLELKYPPNYVFKGL